MSESWFTADTHFGHASILRHAGRPFASVEEMDEALIQNWNANVRQGDNVYHVGDFSWSNREKTAAIRKRLNGNIHLIEGNHDKSAKQIAASFIWFKQLHTVKVNEQPIVLCHYSMEVWSKSHHGAWHLYGHSHNSLPERITHRSFDVGVDAIACRLAGIPQGISPSFTDDIGETKPSDYRPFHFDEVANVMAGKQWQPVDHHTGKEVGA